MSEPADATPAPATTTAPEGASKSERLQILLAILLGTAALATAWAAYRGDLYSGDSVILLNRSVQRQDRASQAFNKAQTAFVQDVSLFTQFALAANRNEKANVDYIQELMSPKLREQVGWWSEQPGGDTGTPFVKEDPHYTPPAQDKTGLRLSEKAGQDFAQARVLDDTGDEYVLYTVIFAAALFLYGIASVASSRRVFLTSIGVGAILFLFALVSLIGTTADAPSLL